MIEIPTWGMTLILSFTSLGLAALSFIYGRLKEGRDRADQKLKEMVEKSKEDAILRADVKYISRSIDTINSSMCKEFGDLDGRLRKQEEESVKKRERLAVIEQTGRSAHHRLDDHEHRIHVLEKGG